VGGTVEEFGSWQVAAELIAMFTVERFSKPSLKEPFHAACRAAMNCIEWQDQWTAAEVAGAIIYFVCCNLTGDVTNAEIASWVNVEVARMDACFNECVAKHSDLVLKKLWG